MQLMIDILQETPERLRLASKFLEDHAALIEKSESGRTDESLGLNVPSVPAGTTAAPPAPPAPPPPPSNVLPFVPPVPSSVVTPTATVTPPAPSAPPVASTLLVPASPVTMTTGASPTDEYDSAGIPWDARIHQKTKNKKKDGTYKLLKGVDSGLVSSVVVELQSQGRIRQNMAGQSTVPSVPQPDPLTLFGKTALPPGASAPVSLSPQTYQVGQLPPPPPAPGTYPQSSQENTQAQNAQVPAPPAPPQASVNLPPAPPVPVPPSASMGMPNAGQPPVLPAVSEFRALVDKITKLRTAGKLTSDQVNAAIQQAGAPSLQMLGSLSHLVPTVDALIDATLAMG